ncbi:MAG: hypothetical protein H6Q03_2357, partial [Acidobacteria bacterium]|nr:hypothetical protein [Acidobacteriota bacterium]
AHERHGLGVEPGQVGRRELGAQVGGMGEQSAHGGHPR